jgi:hypothetical protein
MTMRRRLSVAAAALFIVLAGCVPTAMAPTVVVTPGPGKSAAAFAADQSGCSALANQQIAPAIQAANNQIVGNALLGATLGGGSTATAGASNSAVGANAAAGAATAGATNAQTAQATLQHQFNITYSQCMYAKGDIVPGLTPVATEEPAPVTHHARRYAHKKPAATASSSAASTGGNYVEPAPAATGGGGFAEPQPAAAAGGGGFVEPQPAAAAGASSGFAVPPPVAH